MNEWSEKLLAETMQDLEDLQATMDMKIEEYVKRTVKKYPDQEHLLRNYDAAWAFRTGEASARITAIITNLNLIKKWEKEDKNNE